MSYANANELYVRPSRSSELVMASDSDDHIWDDSSMTAAYDKAVNKANEEIAKQIAMETNTKSKGNAKPNEKKGKAAPPKTKLWKLGMHCRAVYIEDGLEYEATITAILDSMECVVKFVGYENSEIVNIDSLKESRGSDARIHQIEAAIGQNMDDGFESLSNEDMSVSVSANEAVAGSNHKKPKKSSKKKPQRKQAPNLPDLPNIQDLFRLSSAMAAPTMPDFRLPQIPFPPPPPLMTQTEDQALSSMLISWYMSGYHTGLYQGLKRSKESHRQ